MTETTPDFQAYEAKIVARDALAAELAPVNRAALFDALASAGIHTVVVAFDGSGDSGQIESVTAFGPDNASMTLPAEPIAFGTVEFGSLHAKHGTRLAMQVIETMAYEFLERTHDGWENDDGAHGEFTFTVAGRSIELDYNERYTASDHHHHEL